MVGGTVAEIIVKEDRIWLNANDTTYPNDYCAIYVERNENSEKIQKGDVIWWQGKVCYWTPIKSAGLVTVYPALAGKQGEHFDIKIPKIGYSGVPHPGQRIIEEAFAAV